MKQARLRRLGGVRRLRVRTGDILVLSVPEHLSKEAAERIREHVEPKLPPGVTVWVMGGGMSVSVLGR